MSEIFGYVKPPLEELRDLLPGTDGFDFGTSPHGLSADLPEAVQKTQEAPGCCPPAKPVLTFSFTEAQRAALSFAALSEAEDLAEGHEAHELEVQEAIRHLGEARRILEGAAA